MSTNIEIDIHKAKELVLILNKVAQAILALPEKKQMLVDIDDIKRILEEAKIKEDADVNMDSRKLERAS